MGTIKAGTCFPWSTAALLLCVVVASLWRVSAGDAADDVAPGAAALANAEYRLSSVPGTVRLKAGRVRLPAAPGAGSEILVTLTPLVAEGEVAGLHVTAVVLVSNTGGTGNFYDLAVMVTEAGEARNLATTLLGDRIRLESLSVRGNEVLVDVVRARPGEPLCCPTQRVVEHYRLEEMKLTRTAVQDIPAPDTRLLGAVWTLREIVRSDGRVVQVADAGHHTLQFKSDWTVQVRADCNGAGGTYRLDGNTLQIRITHHTLAACPPESLSDEYLRLLSLVSGHGFESEELRLTLRDDGGALHFHRGAATAQ